MIWESDVAWINNLKLPGNVELINSQQLLERLSNATAAFVAFNTGPWTSMKKWAKMGMHKEGEIGLLLDGEGQHSPAYRSSSEGERIGSLSDVWPAAPKSQLFGILLKIVGQAWQLSPEALMEQDGWIHESNMLYGRLQRT